MDMIEILLLSSLNIPFPFFHYILGRGSKWFIYCGSCHHNSVYDCNNHCRRLCLFWFLLLYLPLFLSCSENKIFYLPWINFYLGEISWWDWNCWCSWNNSFSSALSPSFKTCSEVILTSSLNHWAKLASVGWRPIFTHSWVCW